MASVVLRASTTSMSVAISGVEWQRMPWTNLGRLVSNRHTSPVPSWERMRTMSPAVGLIGFFLITYYKVRTAGSCQRFLAFFRGGTDTALCSSHPLFSRLTMVFALTGQRGSSAQSAMHLASPNHVIMWLVRLFRFCSSLVAHRQLPGS